MGTYTEQLNIALALDQYQYLKAIAHMRRMSMAAVVRAAIDELIRQDNENIAATCNQTTGEGASCDIQNKAGSK